MTVRTGQAIALQFALVDATNALIAADALPIATLVVAGTDNAAVVTVTDLATGLYKCAVTLPTLTAGQIIQLRVALALNGVTMTRFIWADIADTKLTSDLNDIAAGAAMTLMGAYDAAKTAATATNLATVDTVVDAIKLKTDSLGSGAAGVTMISPVSIIGDTIQLVRGDDYALADGRSLEWSSALWPNLTLATISFGLFYNGASVLTTAGVVVTGGAGITQTVSVDLTAAQTAALVVGWPGTDGRGYSFDIQAVLVGGHSITLQRGTVTVLEDYTP